jgi:DNA-binding PadR family transcriptional regulator
MTTGNVSLRYLILGLLAQKSMSGYDIKRFLKNLSWLVSSPSFGALYPALRALLQDGLVTEDDVSYRGKRPRKVYGITEAGTRALQEWIDQPVAPDASLKSFAMRLILASVFSRSRLVAHLQQRRSQVAVHVAGLAHIMEAPDGEEELQERLALDYGLTLASAELAWLDNTLNRLSQSLPTEVKQGDSVLSTV